MSIRDLSGELRAVAGELDAPAIAESLTAIVARLDRERGHVLVLGEPGVGRCSFVEAVLGIKGVLPVSALPKNPHPIKITPGETTSLSFVTAAGKVLPLDTGHLEPIRPRSGEPSGTIRATLAPDLPRAVRGNDIQIDGLPIGLDRAGWLEKMAGFDAVYMVISALRPLTQLEQETLGQLSALNLDAGRITLVVTQIDLVDQDEAAQVLARVRHFVDGAPGAIPVVPFSAVTPDAYAAELAGIRSSYTVLPSARYALALALTRVAAEELRAVAGQRLVELERFETIRKSGARGDAERAALIERRVSFIRDWIDLEIGGRMVQQVLQQTGEFASAFRAALPKEFEQVNDLDLLKRHGSAYLTDTWERFTEQVHQGMEPKIAAIVDRLNAAIAGDLDDLLADRLDPERSIEALTPYAMHTAVFLPGRARTPAGTAATIGATVGLVVLATTSLGVGALLIAGSYTVRKVNAASQAAKSLQQVTNALYTAHEELEDDWRAAVTQSFNDLVVAMTDETEKIYRTALEKLNERSAEQLREDGRASDRAAGLEAIRDQRLLGIEGALRELAAAGQAEQV